MQFVPDLQLVLYDAQGVAYTEHPQGLRFTKSFFGGEDVELSFFLPLCLDYDYPHIGSGQKAELYSGLHRVFLGVQREIEESRSSSAEGFQVRCGGYKVYLEDYNYGEKGKLWVDTRYPVWRVVEEADVAGTVPDFFRMDRNDRLYISLPVNASVHATGYYGGYAYVCPYDNIKRVSFDYEIVGGAKTSVELYSYDDGFTSGALLWSDAGLTEDPYNDSGNVVLSTERPIVAFFFKDWGDPRYFGVDHYISITNLKVCGFNSIAPTARVVARDIVDELSPSTPISSNTTGIETTGLSLVPMLFEDGETCYDAFKAIASHGDGDHRLYGWGVKSGEDRLFIAKPEYNSVRYIIDPDDAERISRRSSTLGKFLTAAYGRYQDDEGYPQYTDKYYVHITSGGLR